VKLNKGEGQSEEKTRKKLVTLYWSSREPERLERGQGGRGIRGVGRTKKKGVFQGQREYDKNTGNVTGNEGEKKGR